MFKKLAIIGLALLFLAPSILLVAIGALINPAQTSNATCLTTGLIVGAVPDELEVTDASGYSFTLNHQQLTHAATIITTGSSIEGVNRDGVQIALMAALTESTLRMLSNTTHYPESADYPNDGDGSDWSVPDFSECGLGCDSCECAMPFVPLGWGEVSQV